LRFPIFSKAFLISRTLFEICYHRVSLHCIAQLVSSFIRPSLIFVTTSPSNIMYRASPKSGNILDISFGTLDGFCIQMLTQVISPPSIMQTTTNPEKQFHLQSLQYTELSLRIPILALMIEKLAPEKNRGIHAATIPIDKKIRFTHTISLHYHPGTAKVREFNISLLVSISR
jgi:hypothetical protein